MFSMMTTRLVAVLFLTAIASNSVFGTKISRAEEEADLLSKAATEARVDDPMRCLLKAKMEGNKIQLFDVLPGSGWDNLRNEEQAGQLFNFTYSRCQTTADGKFLLPDSVTVVPVLSSNIKTSAEFFDSITSFRSSFSESINGGASVPLEDEMGISGKFSEEARHMFSSQQSENSVTTRAQIQVQLKPDTPLDSAFRGRLLDIAAAHEMNETHQASYLAQLLVRDFGTHIITGAMAGAALVKTDHVDRTFAKTSEGWSVSVKQSVSVSLFEIFNLGSLSTAFHASTDHMTQYQNATLSTTIQAYGGPVYKPTNFSAGMWADQVDENLVFMDRSGDPLNFFVTPAALPELPLSTVEQVATTVQKGIQAYYKFNFMPGCTDTTSPNFAPAANFDDGTCKPPSTNLTFGGVYQTCYTLPGSNNGDLCNDTLVQTNPMTSKLSCPTGYQPVLLHQGSVGSSKTVHSCKHFLFWKYHCHDDHYQSAANYSIYWCLADKQVPADSGYLFGGLYTSQVNNPVTQQRSCPASYVTLKVGAKADLHICVSDDFEFGRPSAVSFAGFVSCNAGNPLAQGANSGSGSWVGQDPSTWPQKCPGGYSKHLATIDQDCEINYCVQTHTMNAPSLPPIRRPPFMHPPAISAPPQDNEILFDRSSRTWHRDEQAKQYLSSLVLQSSDPVASVVAKRELSLSPDASLIGKPSAKMSAGFIAGVSVAGTVGAALLIVVSVVMVRRYRRRRRGLLDE